MTGSKSCGWHKYHIRARAPWMSRRKGCSKTFRRKLHRINPRLLFGNNLRIMQIFLRKERTKKYTAYLLSNNYVFRTWGSHRRWTNVQWYFYILTRSLCVNVHCASLQEQCNQWHLISHRLWPLLQLQWKRCLLHQTCMYVHIPKEEWS